MGAPSAAVPSVDVMPLGIRLVDAIARHDEPALADLLAAAVSFRALTPSRGWEEHSPAGVCEVILGTWFAPHRRIRRLLAVQADVAPPLPRVSYRFETEQADGMYEVEQQAFYLEADGRIAALTVICSGYQPKTG